MRIVALAVLQKEAILLLEESIVCQGADQELAHRIEKKCKRTIDPLVYRVRFANGDLNGGHHTATYVEIDALTPIPVLDQVSEETRIAERSALGNLCVQYHYSLEQREWVKLGPWVEVDLSSPESKDSQALRYLANRNTVQTLARVTPATMKRWEKSDQYNLPHLGRCNRNLNRVVEALKEGRI